VSAVGHRPVVVLGVAGLRGGLDRNHRLNTTGRETRSSPYRRKEGHGALPDTGATRQEMFPVAKDTVPHEHAVSQRTLAVLPG